MLFKFVARLVLSVFVIQTVWPCFSWATEVEAHRPYVPTFTPKTDYGTFFMRVLVDTQETDLGLEDANTLPSTFIPMSTQLSETQRFIDASLSTSSLYTGLRLTEKGLLEWQASNLHFTLALGNSGVSLFVSPLVGIKPTGPVRIFNPHGNVILVGGLEIERLQVRGANIGYVGHMGSIVSLDVYAEATNGAFYIHENTSLITGGVRMYKGKLVNKGAIEARGPLHMHIDNNGFANHGLVIAHGPTTVSGLGQIHNVAPEIDPAHPLEPVKKIPSMFFNGGLDFEEYTGTVLNESNWYSEVLVGTIPKLENKARFVTKRFEHFTVQKFINARGSLFQGSGLVSLTGENWGEIKGESLSLDGTLFNKQKTEGEAQSLVGATESLVFLGLFINEFEAEVKAPRLAMMNDFQNSGLVTGENAQMVVQGTWHNALGGDVEVFSATFKKGALTNTGTLTTQHFEQSGDFFTNAGILTTTTWGQTRGHKFRNTPKAKFHVKGDVSLGQVLENQGKFVVDGAFTSDLDDLQTTDTSSITVLGALGLDVLRDSAVRGTLIGKGPARLTKKGGSSWGKFKLALYGRTDIKDTETTLGGLELVNYGTLDLGVLKKVGNCADLTNKGGVINIEKLSEHFTDIINEPKDLEKGKPAKEHTSYIHVKKGISSVFQLKNGTRFYVDEGNVRIYELIARENSSFVHEKGRTEARKIQGAHQTDESPQVDLDEFSFTPNYSDKPEDAIRIIDSAGFFAKKCIATYGKPIQVFIKKHATIESGNLKGEKLAIEPGVRFTLGRGVHEIDNFQSQGTLQAMPGMHMKTKKLQNGRGTIVSTKDLFLRAFPPSEQAEPRYAIPYSLRTEPLIDLILEERDYSPGTEGCERCSDFCSPGTLHAPGDLHIYWMRGYCLAKSINLFRDEWHCNGTLFLKSKFFWVQEDIPARKPLGADGTEPLVLPPYALDIDVEDFSNPQYRLLAKTLKVKAKKFKLGKDNEHLGSLETVRVVETGADGLETPASQAQTNSLDITVTEDLDTRYGRIFGHGVTHLTSETGNILVGDGKKTTAIYPGGGWEHGDLSYPFYILNGAYIAAKGSVFLTALAGQVLTHLGEIHSHRNLTVKARQFINRAGRVLALGDVLFEGEKYMQDVLDEHYLYTYYFCPKRGQRQNYYHHYFFKTSGASVMKTQGRFNILSPQVVVQGGIIHAAKGIYNAKGHIYGTDL